MKSNFFSDFKKFLSRGNILDLAVAVIIGAAFGKIITSLVGDIIMPLLSLILGGISFSDLKWVIKPAEYDSMGILLKNETALNYGTFIQTMIDFLIIAFCIFMLIRTIGNIQRKITSLTHKEGEKKDQPPPPPPPKSDEVVLLTEIRDLLKKTEEAAEESK